MQTTTRVKIKGRLLLQLSAALLVLSYTSTFAAAIRSEGEFRTLPAKTMSHTRRGCYYCDYHGRRRVQYGRSHRPPFPPPPPPPPRTATN